MRTESVRTHQSCNQACTHCTARRASDDPAEITTRAVLARIDAQLERGATEVVLTGGEPGMRRDLVELVAHLTARGAQSVLETNATLIDEARARALKDAGLSLARVNLGRADDGLDAITRDPGGFDATVRGLRALLAADLDVELAVPLVRDTVERCAELPAFARQLAGASSKLRAIVVQVPIDAPSRDVLVDFPTAARALVRLAEAAARVSLPVRVSADSPLPPCVLPPRTASLRLAFTMTRGGVSRRGYAQVEPCATCDARDRCPGLPEAYVARFGVPPMTPVRGERARRRLSLATHVAEQIESELVQPSHYVDEEGASVAEAIIRVNFHCNQACRFCFVSTHLPEAGFERVQRAIREAAARNAKIVLSGGEPTLNPRLLEHVALARQLSRDAIMLQTNAIQCDDPELPKRLYAAGVTQAFVSLHGSYAELSDAITEAPGTFVRTVRGIDHLRAAGIDVTLNYVVCGRNATDFPAYVALVADRWPGVPINVSFVAPSTDVVPRDTDTVPRYSEVRPHLDAGMRLARERGVTVFGFDTMCGIPLCLAPVDPLAFAHHTPLPVGFDRGEFLRTEQCEGCAVRHACWGLRKGYAQLHGTDELRRVEGTPA